jgi:predicted enzyme related to lactoylglutathione lyase
MTYPHGLITWTDLSSPDIDAAKAFYGGLMGWEPDDILYEGQLVYTMLRSGGKLAAGLGKQSAEMADQGLPPLWTTYINVDDVDSVAAAFAAHGGQIIAPPMDVMESGRMTYGLDPTGAAVGFWQAGNHVGADAFNEPGFLAWNELTTRDPQTAIGFYEAILPWKVEEQDMGGFPYHMIMLGDRPTAGIMTMDDNWPEEIPAHWMTYFRVPDTDAAVTRVAELGGVVSVPAFDTTQGKVAVINDPNGGTFSIVGPAPQQ